MNRQTVQSHDINVEAAFKSFYAVPDYQREYVWETEHVEQLLQDIYNEWDEGHQVDAPEYFIGSIVVCPRKDGVFELIDGQQRMTTLFLILCAIRDRFKKELNKMPPGTIEPMIAAIWTDPSGEDHPRLRLDLQYEDSGDILKYIAQGESFDGIKATTRSIDNIRNAYDVILSFLREFGEDEKKLRAFYGYLINKVKLIRIETEDVAKALKIFETINNRGVGLDSMDLLKNLLFMKADPVQFENLKNKWKEMQDKIFKMGEKPLRFLRYFILSHYDVDNYIIREDEIYDWFSKNEKQCGYANDPLGFAEKLSSAAEAYGHFLNGRDQYGNQNRYLENLQLLGGKAARQHLILLLAGRHLPPELYDRLAQEVEDLFFVYLITREPSRNFERNFARWASELRKVKNDAELTDFINRRFVPAKAELSDRFNDEFRRLYFDSVQQYRIRYILAKLNQYIEIQAFGETESTKWLHRYTSGGFEIEHIFPKEPSKEAAKEFGDYKDPKIANRLGNLVLVEKSINASLGNKPFSQKRDIYKQSQLLLTRAIAERPKIGTNTKIDLAVAELEPFPTWNETTINRRQEMLTKLARRVWNVPMKNNG